MTAEPLPPPVEARETRNRAYVKEVFCSFQGEGLLVGERQIFIRLAGCNLRCPWCDTPEALVAKDAKVARFETAPGSGRFEEVPNPLDVPSVVERVRRIAREHGPVRWVSLTGGEPTIWGRFLEELLPALKARDPAGDGDGLRIFLETDSCFPKVLQAISPWVDFVSADIKVPFAQYNVAKETYAEFLRLVPHGDLQVKVVVTDACPDEDVIEAARLVASVDRSHPLILQPVTPGFDASRPPAPARLLELQRRCLEVLERVRVIPQTHRIVGVL